VGHDNNNNTRWLAYEAGLVAQGREADNRADVTEFAL
jgi:hypothetical protein